MKRQQAFLNKDKKFLKGGLHCHTTRSDGQNTPEIYDFYVEDGKAVIDCSPVAKVRLQSDMHPIRVVEDQEGNITHAEFDIENFWAGPYDYVRISVTDKDGNRAWTNPIFL